MTAATVETGGEPASARAAAHRFLTLDGLRGLAAFAVISDHVPSGAWLSLPGRYLSVDFFWVLSGFVLAHAYGERLRGGLSVFSFMKMRLVRLYPLYLIGFLLGLSVMMVGALKGWGPAPGEALSVAFFGVLFLPMPPPIDAWTGGDLYPANNPSWTLFYELVANLVYAVIARFLSWRVLAGILIVSGVATAITVSQSHVLGAGFQWAEWWVASPRVIYCFFAGVFLFELGRKVRLPTIPAWAAFLVFLAIIIAPVPEAWRRCYDAAAAVVLLPGLVMLASGSKVSGVAARACAWAGLLSYGVYMLHVPIYKLLMLAFARIAFVPSDYFIIVMPLAALAAALATWFYDAPVRGWLGRRAARRG